MIGYVYVGTDNIPRAAAFFDQVLGVIGAKRLADSDRLVHWGVGGRGAGPAFGVRTPSDGQAASVGNGMMVSLAVKDRDQVEAMHAAALKLGGKDEGAPSPHGPDGDYVYYSAYFRDLDGNKFAVYCFGPKEKLWLNVKSI
ncbi:MAG: VOC family protein [Rhodospirillaceae bacterium]|nr:MAG: VOC family protein [Rhodospirillaceae bacterium]